MKRELLGAVLAIGAATTLAVGQSNPNPQNVQSNGGAQPAAAGTVSQTLPPQLQQEVQRTFPGGQVTVLAQRTENGVRAYDLQIRQPNGQTAHATMTEEGNLLTLDQASANNALPPAVQELTQDIWRTPPADVRPMLGRFFWVTIGGANANTGALAAQAGSHIYEMRFDATGRLLDLKSPSQLQHDNWQNWPDAPADVRTRLQQFAQGRFQGAQVQAVKQLPGAPNAYEIRFTLNGGDGWIDTDAGGNVSNEATTIPVNQLPQPVQQALNNTFRGDRVIWAARNDVHFFEITENIGTDSVRIRVQPDGQVLSVREYNGQAQGQGAIPASGRLPANGR